MTRGPARNGDRGRRSPAKTRLRSLTYAKAGMQPPKPLSYMLRLARRRAQKRRPGRFINGTNGPRPKP